MPEVDELQTRILVTAYLSGDQIPQKEIADLLGVSQGQVSKLRKAAKKQGLLRQSVMFERDMVSARDMGRITSFLAGTTTQKDIAAYVGSAGIAPTIRVFSLDEKATANENWQRRLDAFSRRAAPYVRDLLVHSRICATTWGGTLASLASALAALHEAPPHKRHPAAVIPLCGEPLGEMPTSFSSSSLADRFAVILNGNGRHARSIGMIPAFLPGNFTDDEMEVVRKLAGYVSAYTEIFGNGTPSPIRSTRDASAHVPFAEHMDTVLTSIGPAERPLGFGMGRLFLAGDLKREELSRMVIGDIGGICLPRAGLTEEQQARLANVEKRWTGVTRRHLEQCARRAAGFKGNPAAAPPGVIVVAIGSDKARCVLEAITAGLVNHLVVDRDLDEELGTLLRLALSSRGK